MDACESLLNSILTMLAEIKAELIRLNQSVGGA